MKKRGMQRNKEFGLFTKPSFFECRLVKGNVARVLSSDAVFPVMVFFDDEPFGKLGM